MGGGFLVEERERERVREWEKREKILSRPESKMEQDCHQFDDETTQ